jgi:hypothetical protein
VCFIISKTVRFVCRVKDVYVIFCIQYLFKTFIELGRFMIDMGAEVHIGLHDKFMLFVSDFNQIWNPSKMFRRFLNVRFHENPFSGRRGVARGQTDGQTYKYGETIS